MVDNYNKVLNSERDLKKDHPIGEVILLNLIILNFGKAMIQELIKEEFSKNKKYMETFFYTTIN